MTDIDRQLAIYIRKIATGEVRVFQSVGILDLSGDCLDCAAQADRRWCESHAFIWREGNFACDCNRNGFFAQAGGEAYDDDCCTTGRYRIDRIVRLGDRVELYSEHSTEGTGGPF